MSTFETQLTEQFRRLGDDLPGALHAPVRTWRETAFARFQALGIPTIREEDWKYTDLRMLRAARVDASVARAGDDTAFKLADLGIAPFTPHCAVFVDGRFRADMSSLRGLPAGVEAETFGDLLRAGSPKIGHGEQRPDSAFASLNSAFLCDGLRIELAAGVQLDDAIHCVFVTTSRGDPQLNSARLVVDTGPNSRCTIVETHYSTANATGITNALTDLRAAGGARIVHYRIQGDAPAVNHIGNVYIDVGRDATVETCSFAFGAGIARIDVDADLREPGAEVVLNGLFLVDAGQHIDHHTRIRHLAGHTRSTENYKGIADGDGRGVFNGKIYVAQDAQKIEAVQSSKNLLLSDDAEIDTKPELEIYADDVKCAHGATVGQLDEDAYFYLKSRGIDRDTARSMLTFAFAADIAAGIAIEPLRTSIERRIVERTHTTGVNVIASDE